VTTTEAGLMPLVLQLGRAAAATMDVTAALSSVCTTVPEVVGGGGAVILLNSPPADVRALTASDGRAAWLGELQQNAEMGPLHAALRTGRPMLTTDLTRIGPPALAAAAAECGLISSLALPIEFGGERMGALQLLCGTRRPVEAADGDALRPLLDVLAARLVDVRALNAATRAAQPKPSPVPRTTPQLSLPEQRDGANTCEATTRSLPVVTPRLAQGASPSSSSTTSGWFAPSVASPQTPTAP
jgi:transcriptional regulator with GAF, ATPase, and Fis domain